MTYFDKAVYKGDFLKDCKEGYGELTNPDGSVYNGQFSKNHYHQEGKMDYPNGDYYHGTYCYGRRQGVGSFKEGDLSYKGDFFDD